MQNATILKFRGKPISEPERVFLRSLIDWDGVATPSDLGPQITQRHNSVRQSCKRKGWVTFDKHYWRITDAGRDVYSAATLLIFDQVRAQGTRT